MKESFRLSSIGPLLVAGGVLIASVAAGVALRGSWHSSERDDVSFARPHVSRGELVYQLQCANCHGDQGRGDGESALKLRPPPRDFAARPWRFEPTRESIRRVILEGIPGTAMPSARAAVLESDLDDLVEYVHALAHREVEASPSSPLEALAASARFQLFPPGQATPELHVSNAAGESLTLSDLRGRLVLLNFWGVTCEHCLKKMPTLVQLQEEYSSRGLVVVHVCADADEVDEAQSLAREAAPGAVVHVDDTGLANSRFGVTALPTFWLIGPASQAIATAQGSRDWQSADVRALLEANLPAAE
jgi:mono/diheme cytochrome c family protein